MDTHERERMEGKDPMKAQKRENEHVAPPPHEPRVGEDYRHHPRPVPGVDMPGEVPGDDLKVRGRKQGMGYDRGSAEGSNNGRFWSGEDQAR